MTKNRIRILICAIAVALLTSTGAPALSENDQGRHADRETQGIGLWDYFEEIWAVAAAALKQVMSEDPATPQDQEEPLPPSDPEDEPSDEDPTTERFPWTDPNG